MTSPSGCAASATSRSAPLLEALGQHARLVRRDRARLPQARPRLGHALRRRGPADEDDPPARLLADRRHLRLRRADDRPAPARHPAHERAAAAAARQGQHGAGRRAQAGDDRDRRPRRRPRPAGRRRGRRGRASRARSRACAQQDAHRAPPRRPRLTEGGCGSPTGALEVRGADTNNLREVDVDDPARAC